MVTRITKGGNTIDCETHADVMIALAALGVITEHHVPKLRDIIREGTCVTTAYVP